MTIFAAPLTGTVVNAHPDEGFTLLVPALLEADVFGTSDHIGFSVGCRINSDIDTTSWFVSSRTIVRRVAEEVERLRDRVSDLTGLTRQEIARAIGVDRRSLSGFVAEEIRPTEARMLALRALADNVDWAAAHFGEHAREVLRGKNPESSPLRLIAQGKTNIRRELQAAAEQAGIGSSTRITVKRRAGREALYLKAAAAWSNTAQLPSGGGIPRGDAEYEQDLSSAAVSVQATERQRRGQI